MGQTRNAGRTVAARRIALEPTFADVPRHFAQDGDLISSHLIAALSSVFPDGEDFFIRSVRHYRDQITDPVLKQQVAGFIGQEVTHGREHRALNARLDELGYHTKFVERMTRRGIAFRERHVAPIVNLASTAALEHFTATLAELVLRDQQTQDSFGHDAVKNLFLWHALEEAEHKAVAFDVYRAVGGSERLRIFNMKVARYGFLIGTTLQVLISLLLDRATYRPGALRASWRRARQQPFFSREMWEILKQYERRGFHPTDRPTDELVDEWRERLFGAQGTLAAATRTTAAAS
ncbi:MAG TPA: metal-dependent hydrolase [Mycobacteriales bacterium]|jgi:predicted metal-dependent hydrolase|nr:metal-dependent hydrolase [Mycobacteriales bacterium]